MLYVKIIINVHSIFRYFNFFLQEFYLKMDKGFIFSIKDWYDATTMTSTVEDKVFNADLDASLSRYYPTWGSNTPKTSRRKPRRSKSGSSGQESAARRALDEVLIVIQFDPVRGIRRAGAAASDDSIQLFFPESFGSILFRFGQLHCICLFIHRIVSHYENLFAPAMLPGD